MNSLIRPAEQKMLQLKDVEHLGLEHLPHGVAAVPAMPARIVLGMPHLSLGALWEKWFLKEGGPRHWFLLAGATGVDRPEFHDASGEPIYAAFLAVSVRHGAFETAREHDELVFSSQLARISHSQFTSIHRLSVRARPVGEVAMTSTFVWRTQKGRNRSIARAEVPGLPPL